LALFGNFKKAGKLNIDWGMSSSEKQERQPPLYKVAEEIFGEDKKLMMFISMFLKGCRERHRYPTRQAWNMQLGMLQKLSPKERLASVDNSIKYSWNSIVYEKDTKKSKNTVSIEKEDKNNIMPIGF
jgi:hypothetical protein